MDKSNSGKFNFKNWIMKWLNFEKFKLIKLMNLQKIKFWNKMKFKNLNFIKLSFKNWILKLLNLMKLIFQKYHPKIFLSFSLHFSHLWPSCNLDWCIIFRTTNKTKKDTTVRSWPNKGKNSRKLKSKNKKVLAKFSYWYGLYKFWLYQEKTHLVDW